MWKNITPNVYEYLLKGSIKPCNNALIARMVRAPGMKPEVGGSSPPQVETFSVSKPLTLYKNIRSWVENKCVRRAQPKFQMLTLIKINI